MVFYFAGSIRLPFINTYSEGKFHRPFAALFRGAKYAEIFFHSFSLRGRKGINFSPYGKDKLYIIYRKHAVFHLPASQRQMKNKKFTLRPLRLCGEYPETPLQSNRVISPCKPFHFKQLPRPQGGWFAADPRIGKTHPISIACARPHRLRP